MKTEGRFAGSLISDVTAGGDPWHHWLRRDECEAAETSSSFLLFSCRFESSLNAPRWFWLHAEHTCELLLFQDPALRLWYFRYFNGTHSHPNGLILQTDVVCVCEVNTFNTLCGVSAKTHRERSAHMYSGATPSVDLLIWHIMNTRAAASTPSAPTESPRHLHNLQSGMFVIMITTRPHAGINISDGNVHTRSLQSGSYVI